MAQTRRGYIFGAFVSSVFCVILVIVSIATDSWGIRWRLTRLLRYAYVCERPYWGIYLRLHWANGLVTAGLTLSHLRCCWPFSIVSTTYGDNEAQESTVNYGMFGGELALFVLNTPSYHYLHMTCLADIDACAVSCKTEAVAREEEVRALAQGLRPNQACVAVTTINPGEPLPNPPVLSFGIYVGTLVVLFLQLALSVVAAALLLINALKNPTEPILGLPGCVWTSVATALVGLVVMLLFGIYWATSGLSEHLALSHIALIQDLNHSPSLGFSYWLLIGSILCSILNVVLIQLRQYLLERDPPPPTIKVENHSDGTIFLY